MKQKSHLANGLYDTLDRKRFRSNEIGITPNIAIGDLWCALLQSSPWYVYKVHVCIFIFYMYRRTCYSYLLLLCTAEHRAFEIETRA